MIKEQTNGWLSYNDTQFDICRLGTMESLQDNTGKIESFPTMVCLGGFDPKQIQQMVLQLGDKVTDTYATFCARCAAYDTDPLDPTMHFSLFGIGIVPSADGKPIEEMARFDRLNFTRVEIWAIEWMREDSVKFTGRDNSLLARGGQRYKWETEMWDIWTWSSVPSSTTELHAHFLSRISVAPADTLFIAKQLSMSPDIGFVVILNGGELNLLDQKHPIITKLPIRALFENGEMLLDNANLTYSWMNKTMVPSPEWCEFWQNLTVEHSVTPWVEPANLIAEQEDTNGIFLACRPTYVEATRLAMFVKILADEAAQHSSFGLPKIVLPAGYPASEATKCAPLTLEDLAMMNAEASKEADTSPVEDAHV